MDCDVYSTNQHQLSIPTVVIEKGMKIIRAPASVNLMDIFIIKIVKNIHIDVVCKMAFKTTSPGILKHVMHAVTSQLLAPYIVFPHKLHHYRAWLLHVTSDFKLSGQ